MYMYHPLCITDRQIFPSPVLVLTVFLVLLLSHVVAMGSNKSAATGHPPLEIITLENLETKMPKWHPDASCHLYALVDMGRSVEPRPASCLWAAF